MALHPGDIIDGKYRILRCLAEGGMGKVYLGDNTRIGRQVAIKVLHARMAQEGVQVERFELEAQFAARIGSEHVISVLDMGDLPSGDSYMVMEYLEGESLGARLERQGRLGAAEATALLTQALRGIQQAHEALILHRDLKPDNLFLVRRPEGDLVKIVDFGIATMLNETSRKQASTLTQNGMLIGTPAYMSPEQARGRDIDERSDVYALGVILYECLCGQAPFKDDNLQALLFRVALEDPPPLRRRLPEIDPDLAAIVHKAMQHEAEGRYASAAEFREALISWRRQQGLEESIAPPPPREAFSSSVVPVIAPLPLPALAADVLALPPLPGSSLSPQVSPIDPAAHLASSPSWNDGPLSDPLDPVLIAAMQPTPLWRRPFPVAIGATAVALLALTLRPGLHEPTPAHAAVTVEPAHVPASPPVLPTPTALPEDPSPAPRPAARLARATSPTATVLPAASMPVLPAQHDLSAFRSLVETNLAPLGPLPEASAAAPAAAPATPAAASSARLATSKLGDRIVMPRASAETAPPAGPPLASASPGTQDRVFPKDL